MMCIVPFVIVRLSPRPMTQWSFHPQVRVISMRFKETFPRTWIISLIGFVIMNSSLIWGDMLFGSGKSSSQSVVLLSTALNVTITSTSACIWIRTLNYEMHFNKILQEARRKSNPHKRRIRSSIVTFGAHRIYQSMIMPIFTYCGYNNLAWPESRKHMIHSIGKRSLEIIYPKFSP